nr:hypothetical protein [Planctomycetota bacterium]
AFDLLRQIRTEADAHYAEREAAGDQMGMALWARAAEKVRRLALIYACSERHERPAISEAGVAWAWQLVAHQTRRMLAMATVHVYESDFDARQKRALQFIRAKGGAVWQWELNKALRSLSVKERSEVVQNLVDTGQAEQGVETTAGRTGVRIRLGGLAIRGLGGNKVET